MAYKVKIVRGEDQFEFEGDKKFVLEMLNKYEGLSLSTAKKQEAPVSPSKSTPARSASVISSGKKLSAGEFIRQLGFKKHTDMVLAFGYYIEKMSGLSSFTPADINACYYEAKLESSNTSQMIIQNMRNSRMMSARKATIKGKKAYTLTRTGENVIEKKLARPAK